MCRPICWWGSSTSHLDSWGSLIASIQLLWRVAWQSTRSGKTVNETLSGRSTKKAQTIRNRLDQLPPKRLVFQVLIRLPRGGFAGAKKKWEALELQIRGKDRWQVGLCSAHSASSFHGCGILSIVLFDGKTRDGTEDVVRCRGIPHGFWARCTLKCEVSTFRFESKTIWIQKEK